MLKTRFDIDLLSHSPHEIAWFVPGRLVGGLLSRALVVPAGWAALLIQAGADALLVAAGKRLVARAEHELLFVRTTPVACSAESDDLQSSDGYPLRGSIAVPIRILAEPGELSAFRKTIFQGGETLAAAGLQRQLQPALLRVLQHVAARHTAAELVGTLDSASVQEAVQQEIAPKCLTGGLTIGGPVTVRFESPAYREHCRHAADLKRREQHAASAAQIQKALAAAQDARLSHLVALLERMRDVQTGHPSTPLAELLRGFSEPERAQLYSALWHVPQAGPGTRWVAVASGNEVLLFDAKPRGENGGVAPSVRVQLSDELGPLRSLSMDEHCREAGVFIAGAAIGLHILDAATGRLRASLGPPGAIRPEMVLGGINAAAMSHERIFATHSELGLLSWPRPDRTGKPHASSIHPHPGPPPSTGEGIWQAPSASEGISVAESPPAEALFTEITARAQSVRCARVADGSIWFAADESIYAAPLGSATRPTAYTGSESPITALAVADGRVYAGNAAGQLLAWDVSQPHARQVLRPAGGKPVESLHVVNTAGIERLIFADRSHGLAELVIDDRFARLYDAPLPIRRGAAAHDVLAAMNDNRDRLIVWDPRTPERPGALAVIPHFTGGTIQDLCLVTA